jgi:hypothetical protein
MHTRSKPRAIVSHEVGTCQPQLPEQVAICSSPLLTPDEAATWLRVTKGHLARLRVVGGGPLFVKLSRRCIAYRVEDLEAFVASRIRRSTSDEGG